MYQQLYGRASKILTQGCPLAIFFLTIGIAETKAMVIALRAMAVKRVPYLNLLTLGILPFSVCFFGLPSLNLAGGYHGLQPLLV